MEAISCCIAELISQYKMCPVTCAKETDNENADILAPNSIYGIEFWGHSSKTNLRPIKVLQKAALRVIVGDKPGKHVTSHFTKLKIISLKMLFNYRLLKLFLKTYEKDEIDNMVPSHNYDTKKKISKNHSS